MEISGFNNTLKGDLLDTLVKKKTTTQKTGVNSIIGALKI